jgi:hypothetical protein
MIVGRHGARQPPCLGSPTCERVGHALIDTSVDVNNAVVVGGQLHLVTRATLVDLVQFAAG